MSDNVTVVIRGETSFAKVLPSQLTSNYEKTGKEWKFDLVVDDATEREMKKLGIGDRVKLKDTYVDGKPFMSFRQPEFRKDGTTRNDPIKIVDAKNNPWPSNVELGNGTVVDVKLNIKDYGKGKKKGVYVRGIRVLKLVEYNGGDAFEPLTPDDPLYEAAMATPDFEKDFGLTQAPFKVEDDLNDEIPV